VTSGVLAGRVALVTGAGKGVGRGIALALAAEGARVVVSARSEEKAAPVVAEIEARGGEAVTDVCNVAKPEDVEACVAGTVERMGGLDILVNNANVAPYGPLLEVTDKAFDLGFRVGPLAMLRFMRAAHPHLANGGGVIVNLTSGSFLRTHPLELGAYAAIKSSMSALNRAAAVEWGGDGIRVVGLMPFSASDGMDWWKEHDPAAYEQVLDEVPLRRIGDPEADIGRAAVWLCSDDASYITGTTLVVDGGQSYLR
jgi:meso-butanediol dehydrogenase / (S,S)-butanediol dehydrogenase / diacetyl reductase